MPGMERAADVPTNAANTQVGEPAGETDAALAEPEAAAAAQRASAASRGAAHLGEAERRLLAFENQWFRHPGSKEQAIRDTFGLNATRYYQWVNTVIDDPAAMAYDPVLVKRLRRARDKRVRTPSPRRTRLAG